MVPKLEFNVYDDILAKIGPNILVGEFFHLHYISTFFSILFLKQNQFNEFFFVIEFMTAIFY